LIVLQAFDQPEFTGAQRLSIGGPRSVGVIDRQFFYVQASQIGRGVDVQDDIRLAAKCVVVAAADTTLHGPSFIRADVAGGSAIGVAIMARNAALIQIAAREAGAGRRIAGIKGG